MSSLSAAELRAKQKRIMDARNETTDAATSERLRLELRDVATALCQAQAAESTQRKAAAGGSSISTFPGRPSGAARSAEPKTSDKAVGRKPLRELAATFNLPKRQGSILEFVLAPRDSKMDGWFSLGRVHLIGGSSGTGKSTLITKLLIRQEKGEKVFGHLGMKRRPLILFVDRGALSNEETLLRLHISKKDIAMGYVSDAATGVDSAQDIATLIEQHNVPEVVFVEAADSLVEDGNKPHQVVQFMKALQRVAEWYHIALILSVGAPKTRNGEKHQAQRDRIIGSEKWGRHAEDVLTLEFVTDGNGTENDRVLTVQHRNAIAEHFKLEYKKDGSELIEKQRIAEEPSDQEKREAWMRQAGRFTVRKFRLAFNRNNGDAKIILDGLVRERKLQRHRDDKLSWRIT